MSIAACAALVEKGDPDRFSATMAAPVAAREKLWPLYAYNLEIARAPFVTGEGLIAEMRLQWWVDTVEAAARGEPPRAHEVAGPLATLIADGLPAAPLVAMAEARRRDIWREPFADEAALLSHIDSTAGNLMFAAGRSLGAGSEQPFRDAGRAQGLASWFLAVPELMARGLPCLPGDDPARIPELAQVGMAALDRARRKRAAVPAAAQPAFFPACLSAPILRGAAREPQSVQNGTLVPSEFRRRFALARLALTGGW